MLGLALFILLAIAQPGQTTEIFSPLAVLSRRRQLLSCNEEYGDGSIPCGGPESQWCFNPTLGQSCCELDHGFCGSGSYCAPVAGYCCFNGEDLSTCARNGGFDLPDSAAGNVGASDATMATPTGAIRTFSIPPFLGADPRQTTIFSAYSTTCSGTPSFTVNVVIPVTNMSTAASTQASMPTSPTIQVSKSNGYNRALINPLIVVAVVGAFAIQ